MITRVFPWFHIFWLCFVTISAVYVRLFCGCTKPVFLIFWVRSAQFLTALLKPLFAALAVAKLGISIDGFQFDWKFISFNRKRYARLAWTIANRVSKMMNSGILKSCRFKRETYLSNGATEIIWIAVVTQAIFLATVKKTSVLHKLWLR